MVTPWTVACQASLSVEVSRQEYWTGLPFPSPGALPHPGIEPGSPALQADSLLSEPLGVLETPPGSPDAAPLVLAGSAVGAHRSKSFVERSKDHMDQLHEWLEAMVQCGWPDPPCPRVPSLMRSWPCTQSLGHLTGRRWGGPKENGARPAHFLNVWLFRSMFLV